MDPLEKRLKCTRRENSFVSVVPIRGHIIRFKVEQNPATLYWQAWGVIELIEGETFHTFVVSGTTNTFKTEAEAKHAFLQQAKRWVYDRVGS